MRADGTAGPPDSAPAGPQGSEAAAGGHNERASAQLDPAAGQQEHHQKRRTQQQKQVSTSSKAREPAETRCPQLSADDRQQPSGARMSLRARDSTSGPQLGAREAAGHIRDLQVEQFTQVPQQFSQTPYSFSGAISHNNSAGSTSVADTPSAPFFLQTMPADLRVAAPTSQQASGPTAKVTGQLNFAAAFDRSAEHKQLGNLMAMAAARQQQQNLLSQFSSLHGLSAVASAMQHQNHQSHSKPHEFSFGTFATTSHLDAVSQQQFPTMERPAPRKPPGRRRRGARKCRKVYGMAQRPLWCTQCKWKKACSRFAASADVQQAEQVSTTTNFARRPTVPKTRGPPIDYRMAAAASAAANGNHLIRNLLDMSASFQRLQASVAQPNFRSNAQL